MYLCVWVGRCFCVFCVSLGFLLVSVVSPSLLFLISIYTYLFIISNITGKAQFLFYIYSNASLGEYSNATIIYNDKDYTKTII